MRQWRGRARDKTIDDTVALATYTKDKDGAGSRLYKTCVDGQEKYSETEPAKAPDEAEARLDKTHDEENEEEAKANGEGDKKVGIGVQNTKEDEEAEANDEGGKEVDGEIKLHKTETNPNDKEDGDTEMGEDIKLPNEKGDAKAMDQGGNKWMRKSNFLK